jgi:anti-sigma regulatory factor (Ser/Thr protein kinase)
MQQNIKADSMPRIKTKDFVFNNQAAGLYPLVTDIIAYIQKHAQVNEGTQAKLKMILVELLTNALKHTSQSIAIIKVELTEGSIVIQKTDTGNGLAIQCDNNLLEWPLPGVHHAGTIITIYNNSNAVLKAKLQDNCNLQFFIEETSETDPIDINSLAEHFGLMIITRAANTFTYCFDIDNCSNNFFISLTT